MPTSSWPAASGCGSRENFQLVKELAEVLGGEYGGSRPLVQKGWITADRQIGQTGKTIRPKLYIAAGISGAIQHRVGVEGADLIVAINTDKNAPIFDFAHVGIVTDAVRLLPALTEAFRKRLSPHIARPAGELKESSHDRRKIRCDRRRRRPCRQRRRLHAWPSAG